MVNHQLTVSPIPPWIRTQKTGALRRVLNVHRAVHSPRGAGIVSTSQVFFPRCGFIRLHYCNYNANFVATVSQPVRSWRLRE